MKTLLPNNAYLGDCLELMHRIPDASIDMILADLPYGTTACKWDTIIPWQALWQHYERITKNNAAIVLTASQPFTTDLINSNRKLYRYSWVWEKEMGVNFLNAKRQPLKVHEDICVFYKQQPIYHPQMTQGKPYAIHANGKGPDVYGAVNRISTVSNGLRYPRSVIEFKRETSLHPTQKPVALFEYLIKTYTNEGAIVLDNTAGSMTTAVACINTKRQFICIEKDATYFDKGLKRINV